MRILGTVASSSREVPNAPTIGTATDVGTSRTYNNGAATVTFTAPTFDGGLPITGYTVTSSPGGFTASGASSPLTVTGLASNTSYTFTVTATNSRGTGAASSASNSITATTVPQAPTIGTATATGPTTATVAYTAGATGGKAVSAYTATSSPGSLTGTGASPITVSGLTSGTAYTFTVTATNANGTSTASAASNSVTPVAPSLGAWSLSTSVPNNSNVISGGVGAGNTSIVWVGGGLSNGDTVTDWGNKWNGSSWSASNSNIPTWATSFQRLTTSGSSNALMRIAGYSTGFTLTSSTSIYSGSTWSSGSSFPAASNGTGFASLNGSGNVRTLGGSSLGGDNSFYQTSFGGSWTNSGVTSPVANNNIVTGVDNNFGGEGWFWRKNTADAYKCTSITSAWTAMTSAPWGNISNNYFVVPTVVGSTVLVLPSYNSSPIGGKPYTFNGTTYTAQTALTAVPNWDLATLGAIGNVVSYIRQTGTPNGNENYHYRATLA